MIRLVIGSVYGLGVGISFFLCHLFLYNIHMSAINAWIPLEVVNSIEFLALVVYWTGEIVFQ